MKARILVIDDEPAIRDTMRMTLEYDGHECLTAGSGQEGLTLAEKENPDLVFLDIKMPGMDGLEVLSRLRGMNEALPVVIVSAHGSASAALEAGREPTGRPRAVGCSSGCLPHQPLFRSRRRHRGG